MKILKTILFIFVIHVAVANPIPKLNLLHINGLNTTRDKATRNIAKYKLVGKVSSNALWDVIYNPTQSDSEWDWVASIKGVIDVWKQKWYENNILPTVDDIMQQVMIAKGVDYPVGSNKYNQLESQLLQQSKDLILDHGGKT